MSNFRESARLVARLGATLLALGCLVVQGECASSAAFRAKTAYSLVRKSLNGLEKLPASPKTPPQMECLDWYWSQISARANALAVSIQELTAEPRGQRAMADLQCCEDALKAYQTQSLAVFVRSWCSADSKLGDALDKVAGEEGDG